jgi:hypothetical protein
METEVKNNWVTVASSSWLSDAQIIQGQLASEGIDSFAPDAHMATINPAALGMRIRIQVQEKDLKRAQEILGAAIESSEKCPACGSTDREELRPKAKNWFYALLSFLFLVPIRGGRTQKICAHCRAKLLP